MKSFQVADFNAPLTEVDQPTPQPTGTQVLIKVKAAGVCHSDLHIWEGGYDLGHGRKPLSLKDRGVSLPRTMGHETVGEIVAFGPDVKEATGRSQGRRRRAGLSLARLRQMRDLPGRRREHVRRQAERARRLLRRRLCRSHDGAASEISARSEGARSRHRRALCLFRRHHLQRAEEGRERLRHADRDLRRRRPRPDGAVAVEGDGRQGRDRGRYRRAEARGGREGRRARDRRRQGAGRAGATRAEGRRADPRGDRSGRQRRRPRNSVSTA